jgi:hypothetical protein
MADKLRLLGTIAPPGQGEVISKTLMGLGVDDGRIARELEQAGREAVEERDRQDQRALDPEGRWEVTEEIRDSLPRDFTMVIMADAFMTRERDDWGRSQEIRAGGGEPERWHETKAGTIFLLDDRVACGDKKSRPVILERSFLATRRDAFDFGQMLYAQAVRQGLLRAKHVYFVADGAAWLWNIHKQRFAGSTGTLDFFHATQHLHAVARARHGDEDQAKKWVQPLLHQLRHGRQAGVLKTLRELADVVEAIEPERRDVDDKTILREWEYFNSHRKHIAYGSRAKRGLPIGSGCIESTCKQYQVRVKRCGQFWSTENLEGLLCLYGGYLQACWN